MKCKILAGITAILVLVLIVPPIFAETFIDSSAAGYWKDLGNVVNISLLGKGSDPNILSITEAQFNTVYSGDLSWQIEQPAVPEWNHTVFYDFGNGNDNRAVIYKLCRTGPIEDVVASLALDNGGFLWVNGSYVNGATKLGTAIQWEHIFPIDSSLFNNGINYIYVMAHNHGGASGYYFQLTGTGEGLQLIENESECSSNFVLLESFNTKVVPTGVEVTWTTATEVNDLSGFSIWRGQLPAGDTKCSENVESYTETKQIGRFIPAIGNYKGFPYYLKDRSVTLGNTYCYVLVDFDNSGNHYIHFDNIKSAKP